MLSPKLNALGATHCLIVVILLFSSFASKGDETKPSAVPEKFSITSAHRGTFNGKRVSYSAKVSNHLLKKANGDVYAEAVTIAYVSDDATPERPVVFIFNGGPGSPSTWLHMGLVGPKRLVLPNAEDAGLPPYQIIDNALSPLDRADLVFIDPIGTGFSRLAGKGKPEDVYGLAEDAKASADIVREWVRENNRWNAPKYLLGESFGTTRAAGMAPLLEGGMEPMRLNGIIFVSQALDYTGSTPVANNLIAHITYLPSLAATARYHKKGQHIDKPIEQLMDEVRQFATDEYLPALFKGESLSKAQFDSIAKALSGYTGLDINYVKAAKLRILADRFIKELLREQNKIVGRLDSRYQASDGDAVADAPRFDASGSAISAAYSTALRRYMASDLKVTLDRPYVSRFPELSNNWVYYRSKDYSEPSYVNTAPQLADAMQRNPKLKLMVANGYYDLVTPFFDAEYTLNRHDIDVSRVQMHYYQAGHMMYVNEAIFEQLSQDIREFLTAK